MSFPLRASLPLFAFLVLLTGIGGSAHGQAAPDFPGETVQAISRRVQKLKSRGRKTGYLEAYLYRMRQRAFPADQVDWSAYPRARAQRDRLAPAPLRGRAPRRAGRAAPGVPTASARWEFVGPTNLPPPHQIYFGEGTLNGRINDIAYVPGSSGSYYVASSGGGVWKTTDGGTSWTPLSNGSLWANNRTSSVAVHPTNTSIVFAGTGDYDGGTSTYGFGLMKSTDGGQTWSLKTATSVGVSLETSSIRRIVIDPETPSTMHLAAGRNPSVTGYVWRSTDSGETWTRAFAPAKGVWWRDIEYGALSGGSRWLYAVGEATGGYMVRSSDRGASWTAVTLPISTGSWHNGLEIAASRTSPNTVYLLCGLERKIFKSTDAGSNWTDVTNNFPHGNASLGSNYNWSQYTYDAHITCSTHPNTGADMVYVGLIDLVASLDGGANWQSVGQSYTSSARTHNDQHCMAVSPSNPSSMLVGNDGGIYPLSFDGSSNTWTWDSSRNHRLGVTEFYHAAYHPTDPARMLGGTQDNASPAALGDLSNWENPGTGDGGFCAINPVNPNVQYLSSQYLNIQKTSNQWTSRSYITPNDFDGEGRLFIAPLALDPTNPDLLYAGTTYLWRRNDATGAWEPRLGGQQLAASGAVSFIAVAPSDGNRIYAGTSAGALWVSTNQGESWTQINTGTVSLPGRHITVIAVHPTNPSRVLVGVSGTGTGHLWRCDDTLAAARTWTNVSGAGATGLPDIPLNSVALDPSDPTGTYYAATDVGVMYTQDGGGTWTNATAPLGLPNVEVSHLAAVPGTGYLMAATYGRGIWRIPLSTTGAFDFASASYSGAEGGSVTVTVNRSGDTSLAATVQYSATPGTVSAADYTLGGGGTLSFGVGQATATFSVGVNADSLLEANESLTLTLSNPSGAGLGTAATAAVTLTDDPATPAPASLAAVVENGNSIRLTWSDDCGNETAYYVQRKKGTGSWSALATLGAGVTRHLDAGLTFGTLYTYRVCAGNGSLKSGFSSEASATTDTIPAPGGPSVTPLSATQLRVTWTDPVSYETGFRLERRTAASAWSVRTLPAGTTSLTDEGLAPATTYWYRLRTLKDTESSPYSSETSGATMALPAAPTGLTAAASSATRIKLDWTDNAVTETGYRVEQKPGGSTLWTQIASLGVNVTTFYATVTAGNTYSFRVRAVSGARYSAYGNIASAYAGIPTAPTGLAAAAVSATQIRLTWTDTCAFETSFRLERSTNGTTWSARTLPANTRSYQEEALLPATRYYFRVRAVNGLALSPYTSTVEATTWAAPAAPTGLTATVLSATQVRLRWTDNAVSETGFCVERRIGAGAWTEVGSAARNAVSITDATVSGQSYSYRVRAVSGTRYSTYSNIAAATTP